MRRAAICAAALLAAAPAAAETAAGPGARAFQRCISCHSVDPADKGLQGPHLAGVIGRRAAIVPGFDYSPALRRAGADGLVWTAETLDRFMADPEALLPKSAMSMPGVPDAATRRLIVDYLSRR